VSFAHEPPKTSTGAPVIHGKKEETIYAAIDFVAKAPPVVDDGTDDQAPLQPKVNEDED
jgi:hypothetical protein